MATQVHIEHIDDTEANIRANMDLSQIGIFTDQAEEFVWMNDDASKLKYAGIQKHWTGAAFVYEDNDFGEVTLHDDLLVDEYIKRSAGTDDYIRFENDDISIVAGGNAVLDLQDDRAFFRQNLGVHTTAPGAIIESVGSAALLLSESLTDSTRKHPYILSRHYDTDEEHILLATIDSQAATTDLYIGGGLTGSYNAVMMTKFYAAADTTTVTGTEIARVDITGVGIGGNAPAELLEVRKDQNGSTLAQIKNDTGGTSAVAALNVKANSCGGVIGAYDDGFTGNTEYADKIVVGTETNSTALMLMASAGTGVIQLYTGGVASGNKQVTIDAAGDAGFKTATPFDDIAGAGSDLANVSGVHIKATAGDDITGYMICEGEAGGGILLGHSDGGANDKLVRFIVAGGSATFASLNDNLSLNNSPILSMDLGAGTVGCGDAADDGWQFFSHIVDGDATLDRAIRAYTEGDSATNHAIDAEASGGGGTTNIAVAATAANATSNYAFYGGAGKNYFDGDTGIGVLPVADCKLAVEGTIKIKEQADANPDTAAYGQLWVNTASPCELWFTDDAGADTKLA